MMRRYNGVSRSSRPLLPFGGMVVVDARTNAKLEDTTNQLQFQEKEDDAFVRGYFHPLHGVTVNSSTLSCSSSVSHCRSDESRSSIHSTATAEVTQRRGALIKGYDDRLGKDPLSAIVDRRTVAQYSNKMRKGSIASTKKKRFNFLTTERFVHKLPDTTQVQYRREGGVNSIFSTTNNYNYLYFLKFRKWFNSERVDGVKYIPRDLAQRLAHQTQVTLPVPGLMAHATETRSLLRSVRRSSLYLPYDLQSQVRHGYSTNLSLCPEVNEWKKKLDLEHVDLTKSTFRDRPLLDTLCYYVNCCYGRASSNSLAESVYRSYRVGAMPVKEIIDELLTVKVGRKLVDFKLANTTMPLSHQAFIAACVLYRNHPLIPHPNTFVGFAKRRMDAVVAKRNNESFTRVSKGKAKDGSDLPSILDPKYKVGTDMCGVVDYLDSTAYLQSTIRLVSFRNAQTSSAMLIRCRWRDEVINNLRTHHNPQGDFIARIVNTMSAAEQLKIVEFVDKYSHRICRELERELVGISAITAYAAHRSEFRYFHRNPNVYQLLFDSASIMHTCTTSRYIPRYVFMHFSHLHKERYGVFVPYLTIPTRGALLWTHLYRRESFARGIKFSTHRRLTIDKPFEYGDGAPQVMANEFQRLTVLQRAACDFCFPQRLSLGGGKTHANPFNNFCSIRIKELKQQTGLNIPFSAMMAVAAREWFALSQLEKSKYDIKVNFPKNDSLSFPISGTKKIDEIDITKLPSEPIATPLAPKSSKIATRPHIVNLGRYQPTIERFHKDPLIRIDFTRPTENVSLDFFAKKALDIIRLHLDAKKIVAAPSASTALTGDELRSALAQKEKIIHQRRGSDQKEIDHLEKVLLARRKAEMVAEMEQKQKAAAAATEGEGDEEKKKVQGGRKKASSIRSKSRTTAKKAAAFNISDETVLNDENFIAERDVAVAALMEAQDAFKYRHDPNTDPLPSLTRLNKIPQQHIPEPVLVELHRSGIYDQKQPIPFDLEMSKDATDFRINVLRAENPLRTAIATRFARLRRKDGTRVGRMKQIEALAKYQQELKDQGKTDILKKIQEGQNLLAAAASREAASGSIEHSDPTSTFSVAANDDESAAVRYDIAASENASHASDNSSSSGEQQQSDAVGKKKGGGGVVEGFDDEDLTALKAIDDGNEAEIYQDEVDELELFDEFGNPI